MINVGPFESLLKPWNLGSEWGIVRIIHSFAVLRLLADPTSGLKANISCSGASDLGSNLSSGSNLVVGTRKCYDGSQVLPSLALRESKASHFRSSSHTSTRPTLVDNLLF